MWSRLIGKVPKKEKVSVIMILTTSPSLQERNTIEIGVDRMAHDLNIVESHFNITVTSKDATKILDVLLLALLVILNLL